MQTVPFTFDTDSPCDKVSSADNEFYQELDVHSLDSSSVVYGFTPQDWNIEAIPRELVYAQSYEVNYSQVLSSSYDDLRAEFDISILFEMMVQGTVMLERAVGDASDRDSYNCSLSDGRYDLDTDSSSMIFSDDSSGSGSGSDQDLGDDSEE